MHSQQKQAHMHINVHSYAHLYSLSFRTLQYASNASSGILPIARFSRISGHSPDGEALLQKIGIENIVEILSGFVSQSSPAYQGMERDTGERMHK